MWKPKRCGQQRVLVDLGRLRLVLARALEGVLEQGVVEQPGGDVVEHHRDDDLVRPVRALSTPAMAPHRAPATQAGERARRAGAAGPGGPR